MEIVVREAILNKQCREIWLSDSNITSVGISILASAFSYPNSLEILVISNSGASDDGVKALVKQLSNNANKLIRLGLVNNNITTKGAKYIAQLLETNTILTQLDLEYNQIGDEGVRILTDVIAYRKTRISRLNLSWNALTDKSVDYIAQMIKKSPLLKRILLYDNHVSAIDKIKIAKAKLYANVLKIGQKLGIKRDISKR
jgi:Ran GTPase-activating protein (RanGAP) involved in mRNA processing and transport